MVTFDEQFQLLQEQTCTMLHELQIGIHRNGYRQLVVIIPRFTLDDTQSLTKEVYPYAAKQFGYGSWHPVEHAVRIAILDAWKRRDPAMWKKYFPDINNPPSNKQFIATLAERLKKAPSENERG